MPYKIAVASSDGKSVDQHFGMAKQFLIYDVDSAGEYKLLETRRKDSSSELKGLELGMQKGVNMLADCRAVIAANMGPGAQQSLSAKGIKPFTAPGPIDKVLPEVIEMISQPNNS